MAVSSRSRVAATRWAGAGGGAASPDCHGACRAPSAPRRTGVSGAGVGLVGMIGAKLVTPEARTGSSGLIGRTRGMAFEAAGTSAAALQRVGEGRDQRVAGFEFGLARRQLVDAGFHRILFQQSAARQAVDVGAQRGDAVFIGVLAGCLAGNQPRREIILAQHIPDRATAAGRGHRQPCQPQHSGRPPHRIGSLSDQP